MEAKEGGPVLPQEFKNKFVYCTDVLECQVGGRAYTMGATVGWCIDVSTSSPCGSVVFTDLKLTKYVEPKTRKYHALVQVACAGDSSDGG